jgi:hypothetical protein
MYTARSCEVHKEVKALGTFYWNRDAGFRYVHLPGGVSGFKASGFKTSGFKTSGFKTSGLQNVRFTKRQVSKRLVSKFNIYLLNKKYRNCQVCIPNVSKECVIFYLLPLK